MFPTFLFVHDHPDPSAMNQQLTAFSYGARAADPEGRSVSGRNSWQSQPLRPHPELQPLMGFVEETIARVRVYLDIDARFSFRITDTWININGKGSYNATHIHGGVYFGGVYYVKTHEGCGHIQFHEPSNIRESHCPPYARITPRNCFVQQCAAKAGRLCIFPAYLPHEVTENTVDDERISIAFNVAGE
ncbi:MAG: hypothetical protein GWO29_01480 [Gammaproteobacteria bacterium]|nr:hypothetical protein [Gammaproteobacteria bacterium]NIW00786.1 hypothetical protein [Gammaproteobacteria bacterium]NIX98390.1 hypothetical protein [Gammaproteobacteria bacterium]